MKGVLAAGAGLGFALGVLHVDLQRAVEHAQVVAGLVRYPAGEPTSALLLPPWSLINQLVAIPLWLGVSEAWLSWMLSGIMGALSFAAVALVVCALTGRGLLALGAVFVVILSRATDWGPAYPIALYGTSDTYGVIGLSGAVLAIALVGVGAYRAGVLAAGILLAVHAPLGAFAWLTIGTTWVWEAAAGGERLLDRWRRVAGSVAAAALIVTASYLVHRGSLAAVAGAGADASAVMLAFLQHWDGHRQPLMLSGALGIVIGLAVLAALWARALPREDAARGSVLRLCAIASVFGLVAAAATWIPFGRQPGWLVALMPGRFANVAVMLAVPVLFGLTYRLPVRWGAAMPLLLGAGLLASGRSTVWNLVFDYPRGVTGSGVDQLTVLGLVALVTAFIAIAGLHRPDEARTGAGARLLHAALALTLVGATLVTFFGARRAYFARSRVLFDRTNDVVFQVAEDPGGRILTGGDLHLVQLRTRMPVLIDGGALDVLPDAPQAGPALARILRDVYQIDVFSPPDGMPPNGRVPTDFNRAAWEELTRDDWRRIRRDYGVTRVVTYGGWLLDLPSLMMGSGLQVFEIR